MRTSQKDDETRREFLRKTGYVVPAVLTLKAVPAFASHGSTDHRDDDGDGDDKQGNEGEKLGPLNRLLNDVGEHHHH